MPVPLPTQTQHQVHQWLPAKGCRRLVPCDFAEQLWILEVHLVAWRIEAPIVERVLEVESELHVPQRSLKGKFFYMSPEMIAGRPVDHRADIFAAGVMLYEQLCGRRPFTGQSPDEVLQRIAEGKQKRPTEFDP